MPGPPKLKFRELPRLPGGERDRPQIVVEHNDQKSIHLLPEGTSWLGRSERCGIRVDLAGVHSRHAKLRRSGNRVFLSPSAAVLVDGVPLTEMTLMQAGQHFAIGTAGLSLVMAERQDEIAGVSLRAAPVAKAGPVPTVDWLARWNDCMADVSRWSISEIFRHFLDLSQASSAVLARAFSDGEWTALAAFNMNDGPALEEVVELEVDDGKWRLTYSGADEANAAITFQVARLALTSLALSASATQLRVVTAVGVKGWSGLVGQRIRSYCESFTSICQSAENVLVLGETGVGKELAARAIHDLWQREGHFVAINCAAVPADLLDAELFGIEAGAATGVVERKGRIQQAEGGTLFLDEVSELPLLLQSKLLRFVQEREYSRVGGSKVIQADIRVVAASNRDEAELRNGTAMRRDLYFRLGQAILPIPPLRKRRDDLAELCGFYLQGWERQFARGVRGISLSALEALKAYSWPGNVRELQNILRSLYATATPGRLIQRAQLPEMFRFQPTEMGTLAKRLEALERDEITRQLKLSANVREAAEELGWSEGYLYRRIKKLNISRV